MTIQRAVFGFLVVGGLALAGSACRDATFEPPPGCIVDSETAVELADEHVRESGLGWGEATSLYFSGELWRVAYQTPDGESERALIVNCVTAEITPG